MPRGIHLKPLDLNQIKADFLTTTGRKPTQDERIYASRLGAMSIRDIAIAENLTESEVEDAIFRAAANSRSRLAAEQAIGPVLEIDRMDLLLRALMPAAETGDLGAIDRVNQISKERRKLMGMDAPEVKATLTANLDGVDLKLLTADELRVLEKLQTNMKKPPSLGAGSRYSGGLGSLSGSVIDVVTEPVPLQPAPELPPPDSPSGETPQPAPTGVAPETAPKPRRASKPLRPARKPSAHPEPTPEPVPEDPGAQSLPTATGPGDVLPSDR